MEEWRKEAKELQRQQEMKVFIEGRLKYPKAADTAPFGTDADKQHQGKQHQLSLAQERLKVSSE